MEIINPNTLPDIAPLGCSTEAHLPPHHDGSGSPFCFSTSDPPLHPDYGD